MTIATTAQLNSQVQSMSQCCAAADAPVSARVGFEQMYRAHREEIAAYVHRRIGHRQCAEDIVADVFLSALLAWPKYRDRGHGPRPWLYRIATNAVNDALRKRRVRRAANRHQPVNDPPPPEAGLNRAEQAQAVRRALLQLPKRQQTVLSLHYLQEIPLRDIAEILSCRVGTVKSRLARARRALEVELMQQEHRHDNA